MQFVALASLCSAETQAGMFIKSPALVTPGMFSPDNVLFSQKQDISQITVDSIKFRTDSVLCDSVVAEITASSQLPDPDNKTYHLFYFKSTVVSSTIMSYCDIRS